MSDLPPPPPPNMAPPPGYVAFGTGFDAPQGNFRRISGLGKWLVGLLCVTLAAQAILVLVQFTLKNAAQDYLDGVITTSQFDNKLATYVGIGLLAGAAAVAQLVILIIWTWRMAKNSQLLGRQPQKFGPGATIAINILGGCTLGILPFFMWRELWRASDPEVATGDPRWQNGLVTALIPVHLALTLCGVVAGLISSGSAGAGVGWMQSGSRSEIAKRLNDKMTLIGVNGVLTVAAAVVFIMIVRQLTARHASAIREA
ncbi:MAG: DUF4328 domain-containing protein [Actinomycetota bacterium]